MLAVANSSKKQAGEADRINHDIGPGLLSEILVIGIAYCNGDPNVRRQLASRQDRQDGCIVSTATYDHAFGTFDMNGLLNIVTCGITSDGSDARSRCGLNRFRVRVYDDDLA